MITVATLSSKISSVTPDQIGKCFKVYDYQRKENFYQVENEAGNVDENGDVITYAVRYSKKTGFTCTCKAGQFGRQCKHMVWAVACEQEVRAATTENACEAAHIDGEAGTREHYLEIDGREATPREYARVMASSAKAYKRIPKANNPKAFSILK
jgi:hypothetical protein